MAEPEDPKRFVVQVPSGQYEIQVEGGQYNVAGCDATLTPEQRGASAARHRKGAHGAALREIVVEVAPAGTIRVGVRSRP